MTDPQGQVESYSYNSAGQEIQRVEPDGSITNYSYNSAGQLAELTDGSGALITKYIYNSTGKLVSTDDGNGAVTNYTYDALGNVTEIQTLAANGSVTSQFNYTYDADGQPIIATFTGWDLDLQLRRGGSVGPRGVCLDECFDPQSGSELHIRRSGQSHTDDLQWGGQ